MNTVMIFVLTCSQSLSSHHPQAHPLLRGSIAMKIMMISVMTTAVDGKPGKIMMIINGKPGKARGSLRDFSVEEFPNESGSENLC